MRMGRMADGSFGSRPRTAISEFIPNSSWPLIFEGFRRPVGGGTQKERTSYRKSFLFGTSGDTESAAPVKGTKIEAQRSGFDLEKEPRQNEREVTFLHKKVAANDMSSAATWCARRDLNPHARNEH